MTSRLITRPATWLTVPCLTLAALCGVAASKRVLEINDFDRLLAVKDPVCSQDGRWIAYIVEGADPDADERKSTLWMVNFEGTEHLRLSAAKPSVSAPRFSPDGRYVSFLSSRGTDALSGVVRPLSRARACCARALAALTSGCELDHTIAEWMYGHASGSRGKPKNVI